MSKLNEQFVNSFVTEIARINGTDFEYLSKQIFSLVTKQEILHKGHNLYIKPVGYTADFITDDLELLGQCGTEADYFEELQKPIHDIERSLENHKRCKEIFLFANRRSSGGQLSKLNVEIRARWQNLDVKVFDAERIANLILKNIHNTYKIEEVLNYLPKTFEYYRILPQTNKLPSFKTTYFQRDDEGIIIAKLKVQDYLQIFGISGIGKTELSISIANLIQNEFESIIWLDGDSFANGTLNLSSVHISKFNNSLNLQYFLEEFKILLIIDNLNANVSEFVNLFRATNKHRSKCIITSLQRNLPSSYAYELTFLNDEVAEKILQVSNLKPSIQQAKFIVSEVSGYPLVLNLIVSAIEVDDFSWEDIIDELKNLQHFTDNKNVRLSQRIIGKFIKILNHELQWIKILDNRKISRHFFGEILNRKNIIELEKRSLIRVQDTFFFDTHQLILDSIKLEISEVDQPILNGELELYLSKYNEIKSIDYFRFLLNHTEFVHSIYKALAFDSNLKKNILYALIQSSDSFNSPYWFLQELSQFSFEIKTNYYDLLLFIEKSEIELYQIDKKLSLHAEKSYSIIKELDFVLETTSNPKLVIVLHHHIGKLYLKIKDDANAISNFKKVLEIDKDADYSRLQLARLYVKKKDIMNAEAEIAYVLAKDIDFKNQSLSVLLSFYELLARSEFQKSRSKYIDDNVESFIKVILNSLDSNFEHPYRVVEKLSSHLSYMLRDAYNEICESLPFPSNIANNRDLRFAYAKIKLGQYKMLKYSASEDAVEMGIILKASEEYFSNIDFADDFERKQLLDLFIASEQYDKALNFSEEFENKEDPFYLQNISKILRGQQKYNEALVHIDKAIINGKDQKSFYISAFLNDKAEIIFQKKDKSCIHILDDAIKKQTTTRTKDLWMLKREKWLNEFEN